MFGFCHRRTVDSDAFGDVSLLASCSQLAEQECGTDLEFKIDVCQNPQLTWLGITGELRVMRSEGVRGDEIFKKL